MPEDWPFWAARDGGEEMNDNPPEGPGYHAYWEKLGMSCPACRGAGPQACPEYKDMSPKDIPPRPLTVFERFGFGEGR